MTPIIERMSATPFLGFIFGKGTRCRVKTGRSRRMDLSETPEVLRLSGEVPTISIFRVPSLSSA